MLEPSPNVAKVVSHAVVRQLGAVVAWFAVVVYARVHVAGIVVMVLVVALKLAKTASRTVVAVQTVTAAQQIPSVALDIVVMGCANHLVANLLVRVVQLMMSAALVRVLQVCVDHQVVLGIREVVNRQVIVVQVCIVVQLSVVPRNVNTRALA